VEYLVRLLTVGSVRNELLQPQFLVDLLTAGEEVKRIPLARGTSKIFKFLRSPAAIFDLLTVLPYWIELVFDSERANLPWLRIFRLLRVSRVFKLFRLLNSDLGQLSDANHLLAAVLRQAFPAFLMTLVLVLSALVVFSVLMYTVERGEWYPRSVMEDIELWSSGTVIRLDQGHFVRTRPDGTLELSPFDSIPAAAWWTLATITTVGYGDVVPVTPAGKVVGFAAILYGTVLLGLPIGIIGSQFSTEFGRVAITSRRRLEVTRERAVAAKRRQMKRDDLKASNLNLSTCGALLPQMSPAIPTDAGTSTRPMEVRSLGDSAPHSPLTPASWTSEAHRRRHGTRSTDSDVGDFVVSPSESHGENSPRAVDRRTNWREMVRNRLTMTFIPKSREQALKAVHEAAEKVRQLPLDASEQERLRHAKHNFEDAIQIHGDHLGLSADQQQQWQEDLMAARFCAGPALDRLSVRVLTVLAEAEQVRPAAGSMAQLIRQAWHELCIVCCRNADVVEARTRRGCLHQDQNFVYTSRHASPHCGSEGPACTEPVEVLRAVPSEPALLHGRQPTVAGLDEEGAGHMCENAGKLLSL